jgi:hypothetical protein
MPSYFEIKKRSTRERAFVVLGCENQYLAHPKGTPVTDWDARQLAVYGPGEFHERDYVETSPHSRPFPLFSPRFQAAIEQWFPREVQFLPLRLIKPNGTGEVSGYALGNVLTMLDCLDREQTHGTWYNGRFITLLGSLTLKSPDFSGALFRLKEGTIIASAAFKSMVEEQGFADLDFVPCNSE